MSTHLTRRRSTVVVWLFVLLLLTPLAAAPFADSAGADEETQGSARSDLLSSPTPQWTGSDVERDMRDRYLTIRGGDPTDLLPAYRWNDVMVSYHTPDWAEQSTAERLWMVNPLASENVWQASTWVSNATDALLWLQSAAWWITLNAVRAAVSDVAYAPLLSLADQGYVALTHALFSTGTWLVFILVAVVSIFMAVARGFLVHAAKGALVLVLAAGAALTIYNTTAANEDEVTFGARGTPGWFASNVTNVIDGFAASFSGTVSALIPDFSPEHQSEAYAPPSCVAYRDNLHAVYSGASDAAVAYAEDRSSSSRGPGLPADGELHVRAHGQAVDGYYGALGALSRFWESTSLRTFEFAQFGADTMNFGSRVSCVYLEWMAPEVHPAEHYTLESDALRQQYDGTEWALSVNQVNAAFPIDPSHQEPPFAYLNGYANMDEARMFDYLQARGSCRLDDSGWSGVVNFSELADARDRDTGPQGIAGLVREELDDAELLDEDAVRPEVDRVVEDLEDDHERCSELFAGQCPFTQTDQRGAAGLPATITDRIVERAELDETADDTCGAAFSDPTFGSFPTIESEEEARRVADHPDEDIAEVGRFALAHNAANSGERLLSATVGLIVAVIIAGALVPLAVGAAIGQLGWSIMLALFGLTLAAVAVPARAGRGGVLSPTAKRMLRLTFALFIVAGFFSIVLTFVVLFTAMSQDILMSVLPQQNLSGVLISGVSPLMGLFVAHLLLKQVGAEGMLRPRQALRAPFSVALQAGGQQAPAWMDSARSPVRRATGRAKSTAKGAALGATKGAAAASGNLAAAGAASAWNSERIAGARDRASGRLAATAQSARNSTGTPKGRHARQRTPGEAFTEKVNERVYERESRRKPASQWSQSSYDHLASKIGDINTENRRTGKLIASRLEASGLTDRNGDTSISATDIRDLLAKNDFGEVSRAERRGNLREMRRAREESLRAQQATMQAIVNQLTRKGNGDRR